MVLKEDGLAVTEWSRTSPEVQTAGPLRRNDIGLFMRKVRLPLMNSPG
jgi:hypothetical protein